MDQLGLQLLQPASRSACRSVRSRMKPVKKRSPAGAHLADRQLHREGRAVLALADDDAADADDAPLAGREVAGRGSRHAASR